MSDKKELAQDLAGALVAIFLGCVIFILIIVNIPGTKELDGALIANVFTGGVTLFAPIAAYYLLNNWKEQHNTNIEKEYLKEIFDEFRQYNKYIFKYVYKSTQFIIYEKNFKTGELFRVDQNDLNNFKESYNKLLPILNEYKILSKDEKINSYIEDYNNLSKKTFCILEGIYNLKINFTRNIYGEIEDSDEDILIKTKQHLQQFLMTEQKLKISGIRNNYVYWQILEKFEETHNNFYTYLLDNKLKA